MTELASNIHKLRGLGKTYNEIAKALGCSKGTVCYHLGQDQKIKTKLRKAKEHPYMKKLWRFRCQKYQYSLNYKSNAMRLQRKIHHFFINGGITTMSFTVQDVIKKIGETPCCYLTGQPIDISKTNSYEFDHVIPLSRGGDCSLANLNICTKRANRAKGNMTPDEFVHLCKMVVTKAQQGGIEPPK